MSELPPILVLHNRYRHTGGEEGVVAAEVALLREAGHAVHLREWDNETIGGFGSKLQTFRNADGNAASAAWLAREIETTRAGIVHVHNFFPLLSPSVHHAAREAGCAVVQTLHNYRLLCAAATFLRDGAICTKCPDQGRLHAVAHRCYRGSLPGSLASVAMQRATIGSPAWLESIDRFVALTHFARDRLVANGLPPRRTVVKGNFPPLPPETGPDGPRSGALYVGRLSPEKGVEMLVKTWHRLPDIPLSVMGTGPLEERLRTMAPANVTFHGSRPPEDVALAMRQAALLVMPSAWYEGFPLTLVEAFASKLPVVASDLGGIAEIAGHGRLARLFPHANPAALAACVEALASDAPERRAQAERAHRHYTENLTACANLAQIETIYRDALGERNGNVPRR